MKSEPGHTIAVDVDAIDNVGAVAYFGSVDKRDGKLVTGTSRSVGIVGIGENLAEANDNCEKALNYVRSDASYVRHDIGTAELIQKRVDHMNQIRGQ